MPHSVELGIDAEYKVVNLVEGANFDPEFLKLVSSDTRSSAIVIERFSSEPKCYASHSHPRGKEFHEYRRRDQLPSVHLVGRGGTQDLYHDRCAL
jgi:hypothetical protein